MFRSSAFRAADVVRTPLPISMMMYRSPQRTTLLLPEDPEYNEINSDIRNLKKSCRTPLSVLPERDCSSPYFSFCDHMADSSAAG